jgi:hypothetical protein
MRYAPQRHQAPREKLHVTLQPRIEISKKIRREKLNQSSRDARHKTNANVRRNSSRGNRFFRNNASAASPTARNFSARSEIPAYLRNSEI